jgi:hypothetical protein
MIRPSVPAVTLHRSVAVMRPSVLAAALRPSAVAAVMRPRPSIVPGAAASRAA